MKKMLPWLVIVLVAITLITVAAMILWEYVFKESPAGGVIDQDKIQAEELSAKEISELTVTMDQVTTNLSNLNHMVRISFAFQLSNKKAKQEFELLLHKAKSSIITILADTTADEIRGSEGMDRLVSKIMNEINPFLQEGKISHIYVTDFILTQG